LKEKRDKHIQNGFSFFFLLRVHDKNVSDSNISKKEKTAFTHTHYIYIDRQPQKKNEENRRHDDDNDVDINTLKRMCVYVCTCVFALALEASVVLWSQLMTYAVHFFFFSFVLNIQGKCYLTQSKLKGYQRFYT
jgi:hypothetical protein